MTRQLGLAAVLGISPTALLRADPVELPLLVEAMEHAVKWHQERDRMLARTLISEYAQALKRGR